MSLRAKTTVILAVALGVLILALYGLAQNILIGGFEQLEQRQIEHQVQQTRNAVADELDAMSASNADWAHWDDSYAFIQDLNQDYIDANLFAEALVNLNLNAMIFVNQGGQVLYTIAADLTTGESMDLPDGLADYLAADSELAAHENLESSPRGIELYNGAAMLVSSRPIITSARTGPILGRLIFVRSLDDAKIARLSELLNLSLTSYLYDSTALPDDVRTAQASLSVASPDFVRPVDNETIAAYTLLNDVHGQPALLMRITAPRDVYLQGQQSVSLFLLSLIEVALGAAIVVLLLIRATVLNPVSKLGESVSQIHDIGDLSARIPVTGQDELARLAQNINDMLASLEQSQRQVRERNTSLRERDEQLRTVVNNMPMVVWMVDLTGTLRILDGRGLKALGIHPEAYIDKNIAQANNALPLKKEDFEKALTGTAIGSVVTVRHLIFDVQCAPVRDDRGMVVGVIGVANDVTGRLQAEESLKRANRELERQNKQVQRVLELFRSTLQQIDESIQQGAPSARIKEYLEFVKSEFNKLD